MNRIGILTFHEADNYGAVLQACGLKHACESLGFDVGIIDYSPKYISNQYRYFRITKCLRTNLLKLYNFYGNIQKKWKFNKFRKDYFDIIPYGRSELLAVLCGSDQIWNPNIAGEFDPVYFGKTTFKAGKIIAYAASIGISSIEDSQRLQLKKLLANFDSISVREKSMIPMLTGLTDREIVSVLDPTLLNTSEYWDTVAIPVKNLPNKYIFVYEVSRHLETMEKARYLGEKTGYPIIEVVYEKNRLWIAHRQRNNVGPAEFLTYIKNASYVVTSSFHGTAFSIIYKKDFYTVPHKKFPSRMRDLLEDVGLTERLVSNMNRDDISRIDYGKVESNIESLRDKSLDFISRSILGEKGTKI